MVINITFFILTLISFMSILIIIRMVCVTLKIKAPIFNIIIYIFIIICLYLLLSCLLTNLIEIAMYRDLMQDDRLFKFLYKSYGFYSWYYLLYHRKFYALIHLQFPHESFVVPFYDLIRHYTNFNINFIDIMLYVSNLFNSLKQHPIIIDSLHFEPFFIFFFEHDLFIHLNLLIFVCLLLLLFLIFFFLYFIFKLFYELFFK